MLELSEEHKTLPAYCFEVLSCGLQGGLGEEEGNLVLKNAPSFTVLDQRLDKVSCPVFITWKKLDDHGEFRLRGCIGTFAPLPLRDALIYYSLESAFRDSRFPPITLTEVDRLVCTVSVLVNFDANAVDILDWDIEKHGIRIQFSVGKRNYGATYLPGVASEQGWSKDRTIGELVKKSGYRDAMTPELRSKIQLTRYEALKITCSYAEYQMVVKA